MTRLERVQLAVVDVGADKNHLQSGRAAVQYVGNHGRGKSTRLLALHSCFPACSYIQLREKTSLDPNYSGMLFVDSVAHLSYRDRKALFLKASALALTSHIDYAAELRSAGFDVRTILVHETNTQVLRDMFNKRIAYVRRSDSPIPTLSLSFISSLQSLFKDDIRAMEHHLYDLFQEAKEVSDVIL